MKSIYKEDHDPAFSIHLLMSDAGDCVNPLVLRCPGLFYDPSCPQISGGP